MLSDKILYTQQLIKCWVYDIFRKMYPSGKLVTQTAMEVGNGNRNTPLRQPEG